MAAQREHEKTSDLNGHEGGEEGGEEEPNDEGVPLPLPEQMDELKGMAVAEMEDCRPGERKAAGPKEDDAGVDEGKEEQPLQRGYDVNADLGGDMVEPEEPGEQQHGDGGEAEQGIDANEQADGEAPGEATGADAAAQETKQRAKDLAAQKAPHTKWE